MVRSLPPQEAFSARYAAAGVAVGLRLAGNRVGEALAGSSAQRFGRIAREALGVLDKLVHFPARPSFASRANPYADATRARSVAEYMSAFTLLRPPAIAQSFNAQSSLNAEAQNLAFAWQRVAGANPMQLAALSPAQAKFDSAGNLNAPIVVSRVQFQGAVGKWAPGLELQAALDGGRLFLADYAALSSLANTYDFRGLQRTLTAPVALFWWQQATATSPGLLRPVAIQLGRTATDRSFSPSDGWSWVMARTCVQIADLNIHEAIWHLGRSHFVMEAVGIAAARQLAPPHPLSILLQPHLQWTLAINDYANHDLLAPGGGVEMILAAPLKENLRAIERDLHESFTLRGDAHLINGLKSRGILAKATLPEFPYRDDGLLVWAALSAFVEAYVKLYYTSDELVQSDSELQAFLSEAFLMRVNPVPNRGGIRLGPPGLDTVQTVADLCDVMLTLLWTATAQHACLNFAQYPFMGFTPNLPGAGYGPSPRTGQEGQGDWLKLLPPLDRAQLQTQVAYTLSNVRENKLGSYPAGHFADPRVAPLVRDFVSALVEADQQIAAADSLRPMSYPFLRPSLLPASIHI
jgi:arachidonate 15-lipoxygenase